MNDSCRVVSTVAQNYYILARSRLTDSEGVSRIGWLPLSLALMSILVIPILPTCSWSTKRANGRLNLPSFILQHFFMSFVSGLKTSYRRFDQWTRSLSRAGYALLSAVVAFLVALAVISLLVGELRLVEPVGAAVGIGLTYYFVDPR